jgi:coiled-coil domain-containing protein 12
MGDRKARLAALASKAGRSKPVPTNAQEEESPEDPIEEEQDAKLKFRNYAPKDEALGKDEDDDGNDEQQPKRQRTDETRSALQEALEAAKQDVKPMVATSVEPMAPKKINWDLKRDIGDQLAKLERRTQKAIVELLKERLENEAAAQTNSDSDLD